jgi:hypothetical protein
MSPKHRRSSFFIFTVEKASFHVQNAVQPFIKIKILMVKDLLHCHSSTMEAAFSLRKGEEYLEIFWELFETHGDMCCFSCGFLLFRIVYCFCSGSLVAS